MALTKTQRAVLEAMRRQQMQFYDICGRRPSYTIEGYGRVRRDVVAALEHAQYIYQSTDSVFRGAYAISYRGRCALRGELPI